MGEHLPYKQRVRGSSPLASTTGRACSSFFNSDSHRVTNENGLVAQLVRALACHARGRGFEPHPSRHSRSASVAQLVEQRTENPRVVGSIPTGGTICGFSSFGRAPPCQGGGGGFEPRNPLQKKKNHPSWMVFSFPEPFTGSTNPKGSKIKRSASASSLASARAPIAPRRRGIAERGAAPRPAKQANAARSMPQQKTHFCLPRQRCVFLNDVCQSSQSELYGKMMTATPNDVRFANDVCLTAQWGKHHIIASLYLRSKWRATSLCGA